jgi:hypothetical protein
MAARKKTEDEAQVEATEPTETDVTEQAQALRTAWHAERGRDDFLPWDDLSDEKKQRWLDEVTA